MIEDLNSFFGEDCFFHSLVIKDSQKLIEENFHLLPQNSQNFAQKRRYEYVAGRICALKALEQLNIKNFEIKSGPNREPIWPENIVGSISHHQEFVLAAASKELKGLGVDIEGIIEVERFENIKSQFITKGEEERFKIDHVIGTLIFSAKESLYKALFPTVNEFFGFADAEVIEISDTYAMIKLIKQDKQFQLFRDPIKVSFKRYEEKILTFIKIP